MSGLFGSVTVKGNQITDFAKQTASVGIPIPFGYGRFVAVGQVIWTDDVVTHVQKKSQGKGGIKTEEYTYTRSYAIAFCAGPIYGYLTITRDGKVVYTTDPNATVEDTDFAAKWAQKVAFYLGTRTQMPDSTIEAKEGAGQISAFRDLAYIVIENDDVTNGAGAIPNYQAVVVASPPEVYMTSRPYPVYVEDYSVPGAESAFARIIKIPEGMVSTFASINSVSVHGGIVAYGLHIQDTSVSAQFVSASVHGGIIPVSYGIESLSNSAELRTVNAHGGRIYYDWITASVGKESISISSSLNSVTVE